MKKEQLNPNAFGFPMPVALLGTVFKGKPTFMALAWFCRVNYQPPMIGIALGRTHVTYECIRDNGCFSLSFPGEALMKETDYLGLVSAKHVDKSGVFPVFSGELPNAPLVENCPVAMECRVVESVDLPSNTLFIGEILKAYSEGKYLRGNQVDLALSKPFLLSMPDNRYWSLGQPIAKAWSCGKDLIK